MDPSGHRLPGPAGDPSFTVRLPAVPATLTAVRRRLRAWLDRIGWPLDEQGAVLLTTSEACSNAVEHAYRDRPVGDVQVTATVLADGDERCLVVEVRDRGRWRGRTAADTPGHGLRLMRACLQSCTVRTQEGTVVTLTSRAVPSVPAPAAPGSTGAVPTATLPTATLPTA
ncbi:MAG TPA: ATP-binding protein, partial [Pseudonocardia sp.]